MLQATGRATGRRWWWSRRSRPTRWRPPGTTGSRSPGTATATSWRQLNRYYLAEEAARSRPASTAPAVRRRPQIRNVKPALTTTASRPPPGDCLAGPTGAAADRARSPRSPADPPSRSNNPRPIIARGRACSGRNRHVADPDEPSSGCAAIATFTRAHRHRPFRAACGRISAPATPGKSPAFVLPRGHAAPSRYTPERACGIRYTPEGPVGASTVS